jgi:hypothetical protein
MSKTRAHGPAVAEQCIVTGTRGLTRYVDESHVDNGDLSESGESRVPSALMTIDQRLVPDCLEGGASVTVDLPFSLAPAGPERHTHSPWLNCRCHQGGPWAARAPISEPQNTERTRVLPP